MLILFTIQLYNNNSISNYAIVADNWRVDVNNEKKILFINKKTGIIFVNELPDEILTNIEYFFRQPTSFIITIDMVEIYYLIIIKIEYLNNEG